MVLIGVFTAGWLVWFRREYRFPQALVLIPMGVALSWCLNVVRLAALMWIGSVAGREAALGGFHSQAGWILFTGLAIGTCWASLQVSALRREAAVTRSSPESAGESLELPITAWLAPFMAIQIAAMVSAAARSDFEWLYPLRTLAGAVAIGWHSKQIPRPDFRRWPIVTGVGIAVGWASLAILSPPVTNPLAQLETLRESWQAGWIALRVLGAVLVVPVAEELAFRGISSPGSGWLFPRSRSGCSTGAVGCRESWRGSRWGR